MPQSFLLLTCETPPVRSRNLTRRSSTAVFLRGPKVWDTLVKDFGVDEAKFSQYSTISKEDQLKGYEMMQLCRQFENACNQAYMQGKIRGFMHLDNGQVRVVLPHLLCRCTPDGFVFSSTWLGTEVVLGACTRPASHSCSCLPSPLTNVPLSTPLGRSLSLDPSTGAIALPASP